MTKNRRQQLIFLVPVLLSIIYILVHISRGSLLHDLYPKMTRDAATREQELVDEVYLKDDSSAAQTGNYSESISKSKYVDINASVSTARNSSFDNINDGERKGNLSKMPAADAQAKSKQMMPRHRWKSKARDCIPFLHDTNKKNLKCTPYYNIMDVCNSSKKYYNKKTWRKVRHCPRTRRKPICAFRSSSRINGYASLNIICDMTECNGRPVTVKIIDDDYGTVNGKKIYGKINDLRRGLKKSILKSLKYGYDFIFLTCAKRIQADKTDVFESAKKRGYLQDTVQQLLLLPPNIEMQTSINDKEAASKEHSHAVREHDPDNVSRRFSTRKPNINILVLDSVSRNHFYRSLPKTSSVLRHIDNNNTQILDFELFQSLAPFTFVNVQSFMSGRQDYKKVNDREIDFSVLFKMFKDCGYQTMMQEDACWYDKWGTILTSNKKRKHNIDKHSDLKKQWRLLKNKIKEYSVDNLGLSHASCDILKQYGKTNMFNDGEICFDGKPLSGHFLEYTAATLRTQESIPGSKPQFIYTHLNIAHERTGGRVRMLDLHLSEYLKEITNLRNTITILWSDHGAKTTNYAIKTLAGKFEIYDALLLMIIPSSLLNHISVKAVKNLISNQRALVSVQDLHHSMMFLSRWESVNSTDDLHDKGLFSDQSERTGCEDLPMRRHGLCKCVDNLEIMNLSNSDAYYDILWMTEFSIGKLNNKLTQQLMDRNVGYVKQRSCQSLQNLHFRDAIRETTEQRTRYIFDVVVNHTKTQVFNMQVAMSKDNTLSLFHWQRTSIYQTFDWCRDPSVSLELCICSKKRSTFHAKNASKFGEFANFNREEKREECLKIIERNIADEVKTFLIMNSCRRKIAVEVYEKWNQGWWSSEVFPFKATLIGLATTFLATSRRRQHGQVHYEIGYKLVEN